MVSPLVIIAYQQRYRNVTAIFYFIKFVISLLLSGIQDLTMLLLSFSISREPLNVNVTTIKKGDIPCVCWKDYLWQIQACLNLNMAFALVEAMFTI